MRKPRMLREGARYHVGARANRKEMILEADAAKELFLETVARAKKKFDFSIENFCIMGNHFHMIVLPRRGASLSSIMQWILSVFAMAWNRLHGLTGHVWGERFFSRLIETATEFVEIFRYIAENPVRAGLTRTAEEWPFGGLWHFRTGSRRIVEDPPDLLGTELG